MVKEPRDTNGIGEIDVLEVVLAWWRVLRFNRALVFMLWQE